MPTLDLLYTNGRIILGVKEMGVSVEANGPGDLDFTAPADAARGFLDDDPDPLDLGDVVYTRLNNEQPQAYRLTAERRDRRFSGARGNADIQWTGQHVVAYDLARTALGPGLELVPGDNRVRVEDKNPHQMFSDFLAVAQARGALTDLNITSSPTTDSNGELWETHATHKYRTYSQIDTWLDVLDDGVERRKFDWRVRGTRQLDLFNYGSGRRLDQLAVPVMIDGGLDGTDAPQNRSLVDAATVCVVNGAPGYQVVVDKTADYSLGWHAECGLDFPEVTDLSVLTTAGELEIKRRMAGASGNGVANQINVGLHLQGKRSEVVVPGSTFEVGDWIALRAGGERPDDWRVMHYVLERGAERHKVTASVALGDRLESYQARIARQIDRLTRSSRVDRTI